MKLHPFLALLLGGIAVGVLAGRNVMDVITSFGEGFGATATGVGLLIALGAMFAKLLADSGGADQIVDTIVGQILGAYAAVGDGARRRDHRPADVLRDRPGAADAGHLPGRPSCAGVADHRRYPTLAGLSAMHGLVPPHPGPLAAIGALDADLGTTLALGVLVAIPVIVVSGPLFGRLAGRWVVVDAPHTFDTTPVGGPGAARTDIRRPSFGVTLFSVLLPLVLMLAKAIVDIVINDPENQVQQIFDVIGYPLVALTIAVIVAMFTLGRGSGMDRRRSPRRSRCRCRRSRASCSSSPPVAGSSSR